MNALLSCAPIRDILSSFGLSSPGNIDINIAQNSPDVMSFVRYTLQFSAQSLTILDRLVPIFHSKMPGNVQDPRSHLNMLFNEWNQYTMSISVQSRSKIIPQITYFQVLVLEVVNRFALNQQLPTGLNSSKIQDYPQNNIKVDALFFPDEQSFNKLLQALKSAQRSLDICVFNITDDDLVKTILEIKRRGVNVRIISDDQQSASQGSDVMRMRDEHSIQVRLDKDVSHMHNKFCIIDSQTVLTGSYNWTKGARFQNQENILIIADPQMASKYQAEFEKLWDKFK